VGTVVIVSAAMLTLDGVGRKQPEPPAAGRAPSGAWICPHGGGEDWTVSLFLANPGSAPVTARLSELVGERSPPPKVLEVPSGTTVRVHLAADGRRSATYVEYFGGWIGAGWVTRPGPEENGTAAEPCAAEASRLWYLADGTTQLGEEAYIIVANPFAVGAVVDVAIFTSDRAPIRDSKWTNLVVPGRTSVALHLNERVKGEPAAAVELRVSVGRVAAASLGITGRTGIRSALGSTVPAPGGIFPLMQGSGQTELVLLSTGERAIRFGATLLSEDQPRPAGGLIDQELAAATAHAYAIPLEGGGASAIDLFTLDEATAVGALRVLGPEEDPGSTAGSAAAASAWVLFPASSGGSSTPGAVLVNAGEEDTLVTLRILGADGGTAAAPITVPVPAHSAAAVPPAFMAAAPGAAVSVRAGGGPIVALTASTAPGGKNDGRSFALSMGVSVPQGP
jgi:hypothetical protein